MALPVTAALAAAQAGTLGVGFSGAGFLIPFFLGVIDVLQRQLGVLNPGMPMAGGSSGALVTMTASGLVPLHDMKEEVHRLSEYCLKRGNCYGILQAEVARSAERLLPPDAADRANAAKNTHVAVTYPEPLGRAPARQELVSKFSNRSDLIEALKASIYIPFYAGPSLTMRYRGQSAYDGSFAGPGQGFLPCPFNTTAGGPLGYCIRVSSLPAGLRIFNVFRELLLGEPTNMNHALKLVGNMVTGSDVVTTLSETVRSFAAAPTRAEAGPAGAAGGSAEAPAAAGAGGGGGAPPVPPAAAAAAAAAARAESAQIKRLADDLMALFTPGEGAADIWPGRRHKLPVSPLVWSMWMLQPPTPSQIETIYNLGQAEAHSWAEEAGFVGPRRERGWRAASEAAAGAAPPPKGERAAAGEARVAGARRWGVQEGRR